MKKQRQQQRPFAFSFSQFKHPLYWRGMVTGSIVVLMTYTFFELKKKRQEPIVKPDPEEEGKVKGIIDKEAQVKAARGLEILKYGMPVTGRDVRYYANHALVYDQQKKIPIWVAEQMTADRLKGKANRRNVDFKPDPVLDPMFSAQNTDYRGSGWSRGHMSAAGNNKISQEAMEESFYLTNILPQHLQNNGNFWNRLEMYCRKLTERHASINVISGPVFKPVQTEDGKKEVRYQVIGENNVSVPTHLFKIIITEDKHSKPWSAAAFIVPNDYIGYEHNLKEYQVGVEEVENLVGVKFMPKVNRKALRDLCKQDSCELMGRNEFELYFIGRKLESANTMHRLEKVWAELEEKKLKPDKYLKNLYAERKQTISTFEKAKNEL